MLQLEELQLIMEEALRENGLRLPANDVQDLAFALYEEALGPDDADNGEISIDQLKARLYIPGPSEAGGQGGQLPPHFFRKWSKNSQKKTNFGRNLVFALPTFGV